MTTATPATGTDWLRSRAEAVQTRTARDFRGTESSHALRDYERGRDVEAIQRAYHATREAPKTDPITRIERSGGIRKARGSRPLGGDETGDGSDTGMVPWYVPEGAEFDAEMARGYSVSGNQARIIRAVTSHLNGIDQLTDVEYSELEAVYPEELEDWDLSPMGRTVRAGGWVDQDWTGHLHMTGDPLYPEHNWVDFLEVHADEMFTVGGEAKADTDRLYRKWAERRAEKAPLEPVEGPTKSPAPAERAPVPPPVVEDDERPPVAPPVSPSTTGGLPVDATGRIDPEAWKDAWT